MAELQTDHRSAHVTARKYRAAQGKDHIEPLRRGRQRRQQHGECGEQGGQFQHGFVAAFIAQPAKEEIGSRLQDEHGNREGACFLIA